MVGRQGSLLKPIARDARPLLAGHFHRPKQQDRLSYTLEGAIDFPMPTRVDALLPQEIAHELHLSVEMKPMTEKLLVGFCVRRALLCALAIVPMLMPTAWAQAARRHWSGRTARQADRRVVRGMSAMCACTADCWLLAGDVHRYRRVITFQAVAILTVAPTGASDASCPFSNYILIDGAVYWLYCSTIWLQTRLKGITYVAFN